MSEFVIYTCSCGHYIAEPSIATATPVAPDVVAKTNVTYHCARPEHAMGQPEMRRVVVVPQEE